MSCPYARSAAVTASAYASSSGARPHHPGRLAEMVGEAVRDQVLLNDMALLTRDPDEVTDYLSRIVLITPKE